MTIAILKRTAGQKIARPFSRASSIEEMKELIAYPAAWHIAPAGLSNFDRDKWARKHQASVELTQLNLVHLDTDEPIFEHEGVEFYAFFER